MNHKYLRVAVLVTALAAILSSLSCGHQAPEGQPSLQTLTSQNVAEIKGAFNASSDEVRVLLLVSPTCPVCLQGASAAERILKQFAGRPLRVFVVWEPVLPTDWAPPSTATMGRITDSRVSQFWDKHRLISHLLGEHDRRSIVWDFIAVYPAGPAWKMRPPPALFTGGPVVRAAERAPAAISQALAESGKGIGQSARIKGEPDCSAPNR